MVSLSWFRISVDVGCLATLGLNSCLNRFNQANVAL